VYPTLANQGDFENAFRRCVEIGATVNLDPRALIGQCDAMGLAQLANHLRSGQSHHIKKVEAKKNINKIKT